MKKHRKPRKRKHKPKTVVEKIGGFSIRKPNPDSEYYVVQIRRMNKSETKCFSTLGAARLHCNALITEKINRGLEGFSFSTADREDASRAIRLLSGRSTLEQAAAYWTSHHPEHSSVTLRDAIDQFVDHSERMNCRTSTVTERRQRLGRLATDLGDRPLASIRTADLQEWLSLRGAGAVNQKNLRRCFGTFFSWAAKKGMVQENPARGELFSFPKSDITPVDFFTDAEVTRLLSKATAHRKGLVPLFAVSAFAGLRPDEAFALTWRDVNLKSRKITVRAETSKIRRQRIIENIPANLVKWLMPFRKNNGRLFPYSETTLHRHRREVMGEAKLDKWPVDVLRHSYATHELARKPDIAALAERMGNSPDIVNRHYRGVVTKAEGQRYFKIEPDSGKVIKFAKSA